MNQAQYRKMCEKLREQEQSLDKVYENFDYLWSEDEWSIDQVRLFIRCCVDLTLDESDPGRIIVKAAGKTKEESLIDAILDVVSAQEGKPIPAAAIKTRLPSDFTTSVEQIIAAIKRNEDLEVFGPNLVRLKR